jgi:hypothetical protein
MSTERLTKLELADRFGESAKQIQRYIQEGMPTVGSGYGVRFNWQVCRAWRDNRIRRLEREKIEKSKPLDIENAKARKLEAEAKEAQIRVDQMLGQVVPLSMIDEVAAKISDRMLPILQNAPSNYSLRLEQLGVAADKAQSVIESICTDLTKALQDTSDEHEAEADRDEDEEQEGEADAGAA